MKLLKLFLLLPFLAYNQNFNFSGNLFSDKTKEPIAGAIVKFNNKERLVVTNLNGVFKIKSESNKIEITCVGYATSVFYLHNGNNTLYLTPNIEVLNKVILKNTLKSSGSKVVSGQIVLDEGYIENAPVTLGEKDVFKVLQLTPGVQQGSEGQSGLLVRGGNQGMNLVYIDEVYLHNSSHLGGLFSLINSDFVQKITFFKTSFDASYGGRISSVTNVDTKNNFNNFFLKGSLGLITSKLTLGIPIKEIRTKVLVSGRRTYLDLIQPLFENSIDTENENSALGKGKSYFFYDYLIKTSTRLNKKHEINFLYYNTVDKYTDTDGIDKSNSSWQNNIYGFNWKYKLNSTFRNEFYVSKSDYQLNFKGAFFPIDFKVSSFYKQNTIKNQILIRKNKHFIKVGIEYKQIENLPKKLNASQNNIDYDIPNQEKYSYAFTSLYIDDKFRLTDNLNLKLGLRKTFFNLKESSIFKDYSNSVLEPRISVNYEFKEDEYLKFAYQDLYQFIHQSHIASYSTPVDFFIPSQNNLKPQRGFQYSFSYARDLENLNLEIAVYYKKVKNYSEFVNGSINTLFLENIYDDIITGELNSKGIEFSTSFRFSDKLKGNLNYTFSKTEARFKELNKGNRFPVIFDRPHNINMGLNYDLNKKIELGTNFIFTSGQNFTPPIDIRIVDETPIITYGERNSVRYPSYHRMDVFVSYLFRNTEKYNSKLSLTLYNIYNRQNPFFIKYLVGDFEESSEGVKAEVETLFPFVPSISWSFSFQ
ncbi:hypothetical protein FHR24_000309 [Wenyingzhuangia heitensis]|uniref:TonB-dependent receptor plug domain-containing protein n=1 Tax=Wenyingzhuangia heitensis TaxID=1487859 RepID=A0ABX0U7Z0_9FLAO|nr:TonB-dependent receptor [Wenyingzhuangia heitensis]NIJ43870.1 hypothetical protein [Wenyingzhuangia heitensis]